MSLPPLKVKIGADTSDLENKLNATQTKMLRFAKAAAAAGAAVAAAMGVLARRSMTAIDAQAKLAQSLNTTTKSIQVLSRAGELAGVSMSGIEQATKDLTRRLSQAASGTGPAVKALDRLGLSANYLAQLPLDERVMRINSAIQEFIPAAEQAAIAGQLFGEEGSIAMSRIDTETLRQATQDIKDFGVAVSEQDAEQIERTNDAISRLSLIWEGLGNRIAVQIAPAMERLANIVANITKVTSPFSKALAAVFERIPAYASTIGALGAVLAGRFVAGLIAARLAALGLVGALTALRGALIRTGIGALVVVAGELVFRFMQLVQAAGGFSEAMKLLAEIGVDALRQVGEKGGRILELGLKSAFLSIEAGFLTLIAKMQKEIAGFFEKLRGGFEAVGAQGIADKLGVAAIDLRTAAGETMGSEEAPMPGTAAMARVGSESAMSQAGGLARAGLDAIPGIEKIRELLSGMKEDGITLGNILGQTSNRGVGGEGDGGGAGNAVDPITESLQGQIDVLKNLKQQGRDTWSALGTFIQQFAGKSKAAAIAAIAIQKGLSIAQIIANTAAAQMRALAELGPIAGPPVAAKIGAFGKVQAGLVAATGLAQAASAGGSGSGGSGGGGAAGGASGGATLEQRPTQNVMVDLTNATPSQVDQFQGFADTFNEVTRQGLIPNVMVRSA